MNRFLRRIIDSINLGQDKEKRLKELSTRSSDSVYDLVSDIVRDVKLKSYCYLIEARSNYFASGLYEVVGKKSTYRNETNDIFNKYADRIEDSLAGKGVVLIYVADRIPTYKVYTHYNRELGSLKLFDLILFQEFEILPNNERKASALEESIAKEKIKSTLVYSCYENNTVNILDRVKEGKKTQLNKLYCSTTPLGFCAQNGNLAAFKEIVEAGAAIDKKTVLKKTPLEYAFQHSPQIVDYIYKSHRVVFDKEVQKKGFSIAHKTKVDHLLQLVLDSGADINCANEQFPPLHSFADYGNVEGIQFLLRNGADINSLNKRNESALDRAIRANQTAVITLLREYA